MANMEVSAEDQKDINRFGNLNTQCTALKMELKDLEKKKKDYSDSVEEVQLLDGMESTTLYHLGSAFIELPLENATQQIQNDLAVIDLKVNQLKETIGDKEHEMSILREKLYGKFGRERINLG